MTNLKVWQTSAAAFVTLVFWIFVLALPSTAQSWPGWVQIALAVAGLGTVVAGIAVARLGVKKSGDDKAEFFALGVILVIVGVAAIVIAFMSSESMNLTDGRRFAIGVGGTAVAGFVYAVTRFDTLRAAASVPVVLLLIGVVTWPHANELIEASVRKEIITWMGVILTGSGVAEAAKQIGEATAKARSGSGTQASEISSQGDLA